MMICRVETVNKELNKKAGMKENVSLITDGCDNMLSKVIISATTAIIIAIIIILNITNFCDDMLRKVVITKFIFIMNSWV